MMLSLYRLLTLLLTPLALLRLERGGLADGRWQERLGRIAPPSEQRVWIHAASVGEVNAAQGLIQALLDDGESILLSTMTRTGAERIQTLFGQRVEHRYVPLDNPLATRRWLARARPRLGIIMETEIWPELFLRAGHSGIPLIMVNARLSESAFARYRKLQGLFATALKTLALAICQTSTHAERWRQLGLPDARIRISGNLKFDARIPDQTIELAEQIGSRFGSRPTWTAGSTRPGEEALLLEAHTRVLTEIPDALLLLAPRHPERADEVSRLLDQSGRRWCRFDDIPDQPVEVILIDRIGVLLSCYAAASVAFVGGSLVELGGHNLLEPATLGKAVLAGPYLANQAEAAAALKQSGGLTIVSEVQALTEALSTLLGDPELARQQGGLAQAAVAAGAGSLQRTLNWLRPWLEAQGRPS